MASITLGASVFFIFLPVLMIRKLSVRGDFIGFELLLAVFLWSMFLWDHFRKQVVNARLLIVS